MFAEFLTGFLSEFLAIYDIHRWLRAITWTGFFIIVLLFLQAEGGFPPYAWILSLQTLIALPTRGSAMLWPLFSSLSWSVIWAVLWYVLGRSCYALLQHHRRSLAQLSRQQQAIWTSSNQASLAISTQGSSGGATISGDSLSATIPRLRLPQRSPTPSPYITRPLTDVPGTLTDERFVAEIPTRPIAQSRVTVQLPRGSGSRIQPLQIGIGWHSGLVRQKQLNEDSLTAFQGTCTYQGELLPFGLFVVADGMGGHECGLEASQITLQSMTHTVLQNIIMGKELSHEFFMDMLVGGAEWANMAIYRHAQADGKEMGTTLTAALVINKHAYIINVGDSRTYLYRESAGLLQVTKDHSLVATLVAFGQITPDEVYTHPDRNKIYRSLGHQEDLQVDTFLVDLQRSDRLLLCSDGLWEMVRDPAIERIIRSSEDPTLVSDRLVQSALRGGGADNISVVLVQV